MAKVSKLVSCCHNQPGTWYYMIHGLTRVWLSIVAAKIPSINAFPCSKQKFRSLSHVNANSYMNYIVGSCCFSWAFHCGLCFFKVSTAHMLLPKRSCRSASFYVLDADFLQLWVITFKNRRIGWCLNTYKNPFFNQGKNSGFWSRFPLSQPTET